MERARRALSSFGVPTRSFGSRKILTFLDTWYRPDTPPERHTKEKEWHLEVVAAAAWAEVLGKVQRSSAATRLPMVWFPLILSITRRRQRVGHSFVQHLCRHWSASRRSFPRRSLRWSFHHHHWWCKRLSHLLACNFYVRSSWGVQKRWKRLHVEQKRVGTHACDHSYHTHAWLQLASETR